MACLEDFFVCRLEVVEQRGATDAQYGEPGEGLEGRNVEGSSWWMVRLTQRPSLDTSRLWTLWSRAISD